MQWLSFVNCGPHILSLFYINYKKLTIKQLFKLLEYAITNEIKDKKLEKYKKYIIKELA